MKNQLLLYCRKTRNLTKKDVASKIGISSAKYKEIESGDILMPLKVAKRLSRLYKMGKATYIYDSACQIDSSLARIAIIQNLRQAKIDLLNRLDKIKTKNQSSDNKSRKHN